MSRVKVRFAPSPTGPLHIGGARSALFNYLFVAHHHGDFVLRIEDTDLDRSRREYEEEIIASLKWLGITWNEGMEVGGGNGPYRQTERLDLYQQYAEQLVKNGQAYPCFCSEEELQSERQEMMGRGEMPRYSGRCRDLSAPEIEEKLAKGLKPTIRFRVPAHTVYEVDDLVRGKVHFDSENEGDYIIVKSDGIPTYNFAVVIDDVMMGITHVIRAEEHLSNTPRQLMIYDALNFPRPQFAHISLILGSDRQKMSKRHGATSLIQYREMGYLPQALFNFLALMGWSPEGEEEILDREQLITAFTLDRVAKNPAVFDLDKLNWINAQYIKKTPLQELGAMLRPFLQASVYAEAVAALDGYHFALLIEALRDRITCLADAAEQAEVFFAEPVYEDEARAILQGENTLAVLEAFRKKLPEFNETVEVKQYIKNLTKELGLKPKDVFMPLRCALTGQTHGPDLPYLVMIWGRDGTIARLNAALSLVH
ncbi:MAG: glutamate--tRNA ligase [Syntrophomonadaceae bacterium]|nr:glutamate--tRNA ligase [Syntrophomonadaceae bacterium]